MHSNVPNKSGCVEIGKDLLKCEPAISAITVVPLSFPTCLRTVSVRWQTATACWGGMAPPKLEEGLLGSTFERASKVAGNNL
jgi:hypothetical protein